MKTTLPLGILLALLLAAPAAAQHPHETANANEVLLRQADVSPPLLRVLAGDTVSWRNASFRKHTVTSTAGGFDSGELASARTFTHAFPQTGDYPYVCKIHPSVRGIVAVREVVLEGPPAAVVRGETFELSGRAAPGVLPVVRDGTPVAEVASDGRFAIDLVAQATAEWRVGASDPVRVEVVDRRTVTLMRHGRTLHAQVAPALPGGLVVLQQRRRERFGWWPLRRARLGSGSAATFRMPRRRAAVRVVLTQPDGATVLAASNPLRLPRAR